MNTILYTIVNKRNISLPDYKSDRILKVIFSYTAKSTHRFKLSLFLNLFHSQTLRVIEHEQNSHLICRCLQPKKIHFSRHKKLQATKNKHRFQGAIGSRVFYGETGESWAMRVKRKHRAKWSKRTRRRGREGRAFSVPVQPTSSSLITRFRPMTSHTSSPDKRRQKYLPGRARKRLQPSVYYWVSPKPK